MLIRNFEISKELFVTRNPRYKNQHGPSSHATEFYDYSVCKKIPP